MSLQYKAVSPMLLTAETIPDTMFNMSSRRKDEKEKCSNNIYKDITGKNFPELKICILRLNTVATQQEKKQKGIYVCLHTHTLIELNKAAEDHGYQVKP